MKNRLRSLNRFKASRTNVTVNGLTFLNVRNLLNVCFKRSSRPSLGMADVVARHLTLSAYAAYSGHIIYLPLLVGIKLVENKAAFPKRL